MIHPRYTPPGFIGETLRCLAVCLVAAPLTACSWALPSIVGGDVEETGSITPRAEKRIAADLDGEDWRRAKGALALALDLQGSGRPVKWQNPDSGSEGEIAQIGSPAVVGASVCRPFRATVERRSGTNTAHHGEACRQSGEDWEIRTVKAGQPA